MLCLGLTAVKSEEVMDLLARDYPEKYKEYTEILRERERQQIRERRKEMEMVSRLVSMVILMS